jgi:hypothetical protein
MSTSIFVFSPTSCPHTDFIAGWQEMTLANLSSFPNYPSSQLSEEQNIPFTHSFIICPWVSCLGSRLFQVIEQTLSP